jgi:hypothetical protein
MIGDAIEPLLRLLLLLLLFAIHTNTIKNKPPRSYLPATLRFLVYFTIVQASSKKAISRSRNATATKSKLE